MRERNSFKLNNASLIGALIFSILGQFCIADEPGKYALLIAVTKYAHAEMNGRTPLQFPEADALALGAVLEKAGYKVEYLLGRNAKKKAIEQKLGELRRQADSDGICLVGFFGHGVEFERTETDGTSSIVGCFCPYDTEVQQTVDKDGKPLFQGTTPMIDADPESLVTMEQVLNAMKIAKAGSRVVIADCCRDMPHRARGRNLGLGASFKAADLPSGTVVLFGCKPGEKALERDDWKHGAFTKCLLEDIDRLGRNGLVTTGALADAVKQNVQKLTGRQQTPTPFAVDSIDLMLNMESVAAPKKLPAALPGDEDFRIGLSQYRGVNGNVDEIRALHYFKRASQKGHPLATAWVACSYYYGWGGHEDSVVTAIPMMKGVIPQIEALAATEDSEAQLILGAAYKDGIGVPRDSYNAVRFLGESYRLGNIYAAAFLGTIHQASEPEKAFFYFSDGARKGDPAASLSLASAYNGGVGTKKDYPRYLELMQSLQQRSVPQACHDYSHHFEEFNKEQNEGKVDNKQSLKFKQQAYDLGLRGGTILCFARFYFEDIGASEGETKGLELLAKSAATSIQCQDELIRRISEGAGVEKNEAKAEDWRRHRFKTCLAAAQQGHVDSALRMSHFYSNGDGVEADSKAALKWLIKCQHMAAELTSGLKDLLDVNHEKPADQRIYDPVAGLLSLDEAIQLCDELQTECDGPILSLIRCQIKLLKNSKDRSQANLMIDSLKQLKANPVTLNACIWEIYANCTNALKENSSLCKAMIELQKQAIEEETLFETFGKAQYLDTLAHLYEANGELASAIDAQRRAIQLAPDVQAMQDYLQELQAK